MTCETKNPIDEPDFDWVAARSKCSAKAVYDDLEKIVTRDVESYRNIKPGLRRGTFEFETGGRIEVLGKDKNKNSLGTICFEMKNDAINVSHDDKPLFRVRIQWDRRRAKRLMVA